MRRTILIAITFAAAALGGCSSPPAATTLAVAPGDYARAFQAAKDVLRDTSFDLDRVDAREGVITTQPAASSGLATPWTGQSPSFTGAVRDVMQNHQKVAKIFFTPSDGPESVNAGTGDLREHNRGITMRVVVLVERVYRPNRRIESTAIALSSFASDPDLARRGLEPAYAIESAEDSDLASRLIFQISQALGEPKP